MYRPKNWENPFDERCGTDGYLHIGSTCPHCIFEAGADAMLVGLKKEAITPGRVGSYSFDKKDSLHVDLGWGFGYLVFIPDEEGKK